MSDTKDEGHHPLPKDERARHDLLPESIEDERDLGDDDPAASKASKTEAPRRQYSNPDGSTYET